MANIFQLLGSFETLLADIRNLKSSDMSLQKLAVLIDEELRRVERSKESKHMELEKESNGHLNPIKRAEKGEHAKKKNAFSFLITAMKCTGVIFIILTACVLSVDKNAINRVKGIKGYFMGSAKPDYDISHVEWQFWILQIARWSSTKLNIEKKFPITDYAANVCFVHNPLRMESTSCNCQVTGFNDKKTSDRDAPMVYRNDAIDLNLARLQQVLQRNLIMMNNHTVSINTDLDYVNTVEDLRNNHVLERLEQDTASHVAGTSLSYMSSHILRKEVPRPQNYFENPVQTFRSYFYVDGVKSPSFALGGSYEFDISNFMYVQCTGLRRLVFSPPDECIHKCPTLTRITKPGDIVFYTNIWTVHSESTISSEQSVAFVDNFEWM